MKKLLVLALVLGVVGFANAGLQLNVNGIAGNAGVAGDDIDILMDYTGVDFYTAIVANAPFALVGTVVNMPDMAGEVFSSTWQDDDENPATPLVQIVNGIAPGFDGPVWTLASSTGAAKPMSIFFSIADAQAGIYQVLAIDGEMNATVAGQVVITPEPMTMLLLGLGGLFLCKK